MRKDLYDMLLNYFFTGSVISVYCNQWGDTGKGKILDLLMAIARIGERPMGADNCGHTIVANGQKIVTHMIPSSIVHDALGIVSVIGRGVAFNPLTARRELEMLMDSGVTWENLKISFRAKLTMPYHILFDRLSEARANPDKKIGTTGRGVGPVFQDHVGRTGLCVRDMLDADVMCQKLQHVLPDRITFLKTLDPMLIKELLHHDDLENGLFFHPTEMLDIDAIIVRYLEHGKFFNAVITDAEKYVRSHVGKVTIALEGAQGAILDIDDGSYPFVTSSRCTVAGLAHGAGLREGDITHKIGVVKAYQTRVGAGCMPTEIGGHNAVEIFVRDYKRYSATSDFSLLINDPDPIIQGAAIGRVGGEFGATTGRLRRIGWLDLVALRYAVELNGPDVSITKLDVLTGIKKIPVCVGYTYRGLSNPAIGLEHDQILTVMMPENDILEQCEPIYEILDGWDEDISGVTTYHDLPEKAQYYLDFIEMRADVNIVLISVGPDREQTFFA
ncbi:MAG: adenylosuccinate synthetase [Parcubacteria group bacterium]|jgi:adenylosuccinate synthase